MDRSEFQQSFKSLGPAILPVIHAQSSEQVIRNARCATHNGAHGVFLINHDFHHDQMPAILRDVREALPDLWIGVNFLAVTGLNAFPILAKMQNDGTKINAYWADDARIKETSTSQIEADDIQKIRTQCGWNGLYFGGTAFKKQRPVDPVHYADAASIASRYMDVVTTSGVATGEEADIEKMKIFRQSCRNHPVGLASGITPENVVRYAPYVDAILVATGINFSGDFYNIDPDNLQRLIANIPNQTQ